MGERRIHEVFLVIFVVLLTKILPELAEKRCNSRSDCLNGTYCCFKRRVCRRDCAKIFCLSDDDCLKRRQCCNMNRNKCSKNACHSNDDPYSLPLVFGTLMLVALVFWGVCFYSFCYMMRCSCPRRSTKKQTSSGTSNAGQDSSEAAGTGESEYRTQELKMDE